MERLSRRGFLRMLGASAAVAAVRPTYFLPPVGGWHSDTILNPAELDFSSCADFLTFDDLTLADMVIPAPMLALEGELSARLALTLDALIKIPASREGWPHPIAVNEK